MEEDRTKRSDQIKMLEALLHLQQTKEWKPAFYYQGIHSHMMQEGLVTAGPAGDDPKLTLSGELILWFLEKGPDPMPELKSFTDFILNLKDKENG